MYSPEEIRRRKAMAKKQALKLRKKAGKTKQARSASEQKAKR
jgi:hypothetical protein